MGLSVATRGGLRKERRWEDRGERERERVQSPCVEGVFNRPPALAGRSPGMPEIEQGSSRFLLPHTSSIHPHFPPALPQLPPSTFLPLSPESGSLSSRRRPPASSSSSSTERKLWQRPSELGIDNHGDGAVFPSDFHLLSSPPLVCTQTSPTYRLSPPPPRSLFPPKCSLWQREYARPPTTK